MSEYIDKVEIDGAEYLVQASKFTTNEESIGNECTPIYINSSGSPTECKTMAVTSSAVTSTISENTTIVLNENCIYTYTISSSVNVTFSVANITNQYGAFIRLFINASPSITFTDTTVDPVIDETAMASGQYWEISVFKGSVIMKCLVE